MPCQKVRRGNQYKIKTPNTELSYSGLGYRDLGRR
jgi:hypothetical protein